MSRLSMINTDINNDMRGLYSRQRLSSKSCIGESAGMRESVGGVFEAACLRYLLATSEKRENELIYFFEPIIIISDHRCY